MHIVHIQHIAICIFCILCIFIMKKVLLQVFIVYCHYCLVPHPMAQLFTYHHLQPSPPFADLSQKAQVKSVDSPRMAKGIVPVAPTGTRGRRPSMEDTGITHLESWPHGQELANWYIRVWTWYIHVFTCSQVYIQLWTCMYIVYTCT